MMKQRSWGVLAVLVIILVCLLPQPAVAYIGPGTGLSAIGVFLAVVAGISIALFGFVWYPIKRLLRQKKPRQGGQGGGEE
jgi:membrane protein implicated in regulation of membrane protease activity